MKKILSIISVSLLCGATAAVGWKSKGFTDWSKDTWSFNSSKVESVEEPDLDFAITQADAPTSGIRLSVKPLNADRSVDEESGENEYNISSRSIADSYTVTAYLSPADATDSVVYSLEWSDPNSEFASGKNAEDYIELTSSGLMATVRCKKAFGTTINLKCSGVVEKAVTATCSLEYLCRADDLNGYPHGVKIYNGGGYETYSLSLGGSYNWKPNTYVNSGTVRGTFEYGDLTIDLVQSVKDNIISACSGFDNSYVFRTLTVPSNTSSFVLNFESFINVLYEAQTNKASLKKQLTTACNIQDTDVIVSLPFTYKYGDTVINTGTVYRNCSLDVSGVYVSLTSLGLSSETFVF